MNNRLFIICVFPLLMASSCEEKPEIDYSKIDGLYTCNEASSHSGYRKYIIEIEKVSSQENTYIIDNFHNSGENIFVFAEYILDTLYIHRQGINTISVEGKGKVSDDFRKIDLNYETDDGVVVLDFSARYER